MSKLDLPDWHDWVDAEDVIRKLHITKRTLQNWRNSGVLPYSHVKGKYYYRKSDVLVLLMNNYNGEKGDCDEQYKTNKQQFRRPARDRFG